MNGAEIGILKQSHHVRLSCFLQGKHCLTLEPEITLVLLSNLSHKSLEWQLSDQKLGWLLELPDFSESYRTGSESMRFLDTTTLWHCSSLPCCLVCELFPWSLGSRVLPCGLLGPCHLWRLIVLMSGLTECLSRSSSRQIPSSSLSWKIL